MQLKRNNRTTDSRQRARLACGALIEGRRQQVTDLSPARPAPSFPSPAFSSGEETRFVNGYNGPEKVIFSVSHLVKKYGKNTVLNDVDLTAKAGQIVGLIGKNGVGKSTLVESALGLKPYDSGVVTVDGINIKEEPRQAKALIGYSPSEPLAYDSMTGAEYLAYIASIYRMDPQVARQRAEALTQALALPVSMFEKPFALCSHGTQQKICLAASVIHSPALWILDEPTVGLDIIAYRALLKLMRRYADEGHAILIVTHDMDLVSHICDTVYILAGEKLHQVDPDNQDIAKILEGNR